MVQHIDKTLCMLFLLISSLESNMWVYMMPNGSCMYISNQQKSKREFMSFLYQERDLLYILKPPPHQYVCSSRSAAHPLSFFHQSNPCLNQHVVVAGYWRPLSFQDPLGKKTISHPRPIQYSQTKYAHSFI